MNIRGYSIIEILIVIAIGAVLAGGIFTAYRFMAKENVSRVLVAKSEVDIESMFYQVVKDIETAGFGIEKYKEQNGQKIDGTLICGTCQQNTNDAGILVGDSLSFYSLVSRESRYSGCWAIIMDNNEFDVELQSPKDEFANPPCDPCYLGKIRKNFFWQPCHLKDSDNPSGTEIKMKANYYYIIMTRERIKREVQDLCSDGLCQCGHGSGIQCDGSFKIDEKDQLYAFFATNEPNYSYPQDFIVSYFLAEDPQQNKFCALNDDGKVYNLYKSVGSNPAQPVINCILKDSLRFRVGIKNGSTIQYTANINDIRQAIREGNIKSVKMCMVVQIGGKQLGERGENILTPQKPQFLNSDCGSNPNISDTWWNQTGRYYRWKVIEKEIPLYNFQSTIME